VSDVLADSSDVGTIKIAEKMGNQRFYQTIRDFSIGQSTGIELPGENRGMLHSLPNWTPSSIGSVAIGQEVSVTPIQMISAVSAIANGGTLYTPKIVQDMQGGSAGPLPPRAEPHQATDARTAATLREMMESVIIKGTGKPAKLDGYTAAGKSGTAQKIDKDTGRYSATKYIASFVGFAPVNTPAVTILVMLDSPQGEHMGGNLGGPVFKRVAEQSLAYLEVAHDVQGFSDEEFAKNGTTNGNKSGAKPASAPDANEVKDEARYEAVASQSARANGGDAAGSDAVAISEDGITIPNFSGQPVRAVLEQCSRLGITPNLIGDGLAMEQSPAASTVVPRGTEVTVRFGHAPAKLVPTSSRAGH
jgi:cell division protein FtsI (penicillin-binding protein 3)